MPKGKESQSRQRKSYNKIDINLGEIKSSIRKMSDYAASSASSNGKDSFLNGQESGVIPNNNHLPSDQEKMDISGDNPAPITPKNQKEVQIPTFKKKVKFYLENKFWILLIIYYKN